MTTAPTYRPSTYQRITGLAMTLDLLYLYGPDQASLALYQRAFATFRGMAWLDRAIFFRKLAREVADFEGQVQRSQDSPHQEDFDALRNGPLSRVRDLAFRAQRFAFSFR